MDADGHGRPAVELLLPTALPMIIPEARRFSLQGV
jgi:hypothetical protein